MKESRFFFAIKVLILITILVFGASVLITGANQDSGRTNSVSVSE